LQEQCALAYRKFGLCADSQKAWRFFLEAIVMIGCEMFERRPLLAGVTNKLTLIFANWTQRRRSGGFSKLRSALDADKIFHRG